MIDFGISESGSMVGNLLEKAFRATTPKAQASGMGSWPQAQPNQSNPKPGESFTDFSKRTVVPKSGSSGYTGSTTKKASGGNSGSSKNTKKSSSSSLDEQQAKLRKSLGGQFGSTIDAYKNMIGWLPNEQSNLQEQVEGLANTQKQSVTDAMNAALDKFGGYRQEIDVNQKDTLQDLVDNTRNMFAAGNNYLGARGAGNSSATGMYSAAITQQANRQRADVQQGYDSQRNDINAQESDVKAQHEQQINAIDTWKSTRVSEIVQQYQDLKRQLTLAKAQADDSKKAALAKLDATLFESAINKLNDIQSVSAQYKSDIANTLQSQNGELQGMLGGINQKSQFDVQNQNAVPLEGIENPASLPDGTIVGFYQGRKVQVDQQGNILAVLD